ncbi:MAG: PspC domain-containing protein [Nanoarchaeota archaeon]|nr:PspC domain-containing protein [Nanoarchaeota archaeon]
MADEEKPVLKKVARKRKKTAGKKTSASKTRKRTEKVKISKIRAEPVVNVKHEQVKTDKIISGVSRGVSDYLGVDVSIIRIMFAVSFIFLIGIPIYAFLSLVMKD